MFFEQASHSELYLNDILRPFHESVMEDEKTWLFYAVRRCITHLLIQL
jgi:hypothetical protein